MSRTSCGVRQVAVVGVGGVVVLTLLPAAAVSSQAPTLRLGIGQSAEIRAALHFGCRAAAAVTQLETEDTRPEQWTDVGHCRGRGREQATCAPPPVQRSGTCWAGEGECEDSALCVNLPPVVVVRGRGAAVRSSGTSWLFAARRRTLPQPAPPAAAQSRGRHGGGGWTWTLDTLISL